MPLIWEFVIKRLGIVDAGVIKDTELSSRIPQTGVGALVSETALGWRIAETAAAEADANEYRLVLADELRKLST